MPSQDDMLLALLAEELGSATADKLWADPGFRRLWRLAKIPQLGNIIANASKLAAGALEHENRKANIKTGDQRSPAQLARLAKLRDSLQQVGEFLEGDNVDNKENKVDSKYGRIFTEADVKALVRNAMEREVSSDDELDQIINTMDGTGELTFFPDEPLFIIRGKDKAGPAAVVAYGVKAEEEGSKDDLLARVDEVVSDMRQWQAANPDIVKVAD